MTLSPTKMALEITVTIKFAGDTLELCLPADTALVQLQQELEKRTGLLVRKQKILCKGKTLTAQPPSTPLQQLGIGTGSKLMLLAAAGTASQGQAALKSAQQARAEALRQRREETVARRPPPPQQAASAMEARLSMWNKTGIAALRDLKLTAVPPELISIAGTLRIVDLGGNQLTALPPRISALTSLQKLRLSMNLLQDAGMPWDSVAALQQLAVLALDSNKLTSLPDSLSRLTRLEKLTAEGNQIAALPESVSSLVSLRALSLRGNKLTALPSGLGACAALEEADFSRNRIAQLPLALGLLTKLKCLLLDGNLLRCVPSALLTGASSLSTLSLHGCPVTVEQLRETPGWGEFDSRRRTKYDKQVDMRVLLRGGGFDEGADAEEWERWRGP